MTSTYKKQVLVSLGPVSRFGLATTWEDMLFPRIQQISLKYVLVQEILFTKYLNCQLSVHDLSPPSLWPNALERERLVVPRAKGTHQLSPHSPHTPMIVGSLKGPTINGQGTKQMGPR